MALPGELKGINGTICTDCGARLKLDIHSSGAGYYLGYWCDCCGPYSRESGYFGTYKEAKAALLGKTDQKLRDTEYHTLTTLTVEEEEFTAISEVLANWGK